MCDLASGRYTGLLLAWEWTRDELTLYLHSRPERKPQGNNRQTIFGVLSLPAVQALALQPRPDAVVHLSSRKSREIKEGENKNRNENEKESVSFLHISFHLTQRGSLFFRRTTFFLCFVVIDFFIRLFRVGGEHRRNSYLSCTLMWNAGRRRIPLFHGLAAFAYRMHSRHPWCAHLQRLRGKREREIKNAKLPFLSLRRRNKPRGQREKKKSRM